MQGHGISSANEVLWGPVSGTKEDCLARAEEATRGAIIRHTAAGRQRFFSYSAPELQRCVKQHMQRDTVLEGKEQGLLDEWAIPNGPINLVVDVDGQGGRDGAVALCQQLADFLYGTSSSFARHARADFNGSTNAFVYKVANVTMPISVRAPDDRVPTLTVFASPPERKDKVSFHVYVKLVVPVTSSNCSKLLVLSALAQFLVETPCPETVRFATWVDLHIYSQEPHLRLPMTMKEDEPHSVLRPIWLCKDGCELAGGPPGRSGCANRQEWLRQAANACTLNWLPTEPGDSCLGAIGGLATCPVDFLQECQARLQRAVRTLQTRKFATLTEEETTAFRGLLEEFRRMHGQLRQVQKALAEPWILQRLLGLPRWHCNERVMTDAVERLHVNDYPLVMVRTVLVALSEMHSRQAKKGEVPHIHNGPYCTPKTKVDQETKKRVLEWSRVGHASNQHGDSVAMPLPFFVASTLRRYLSLREPIAFEAKVDLSNWDCVLRKHKNAKPILTITVRPGEKDGRPEAMVRIGCWRGSARCRPNIYITFDSTYLPALERHHVQAQRALLRRDQLLGSQSSLSAFAPMSVHPSRTFEFDQWELQYNELHEYMTKMRPVLQTISRCIVVTGGEQKSSRKWEVYNSLVSPTQYNTIELPRAWNAKQHALFQRWMRLATVPGDDQCLLSSRNPGVIYLTWDWKVVGYTYLCAPDALGRIAFEVLGDDLSQDELISVNPLYVAALDTDTVSAGELLLKFHMAVSHLRPFSRANKMLHTHSNMYTVNEEEIGGDITPVATMDEMVWETIYKAMYTRSIAETPSDTKELPPGTDWFAMLVAPMVPAVKVSYGRCSVLEQKKGSPYKISGSPPFERVLKSAKPTAEEDTSNSNWFHNAIGFRTLIDGYSQCREALMQFPNRNFVFISPFAPSAAMHPSGEGYVQVEPGASTEELCIDGTTKGVVIHGAHLFDSRQTLRLFQRVLCALTDQSSERLRDFQLWVVQPAYCYPPTAQMDAPLRLAAREEGFQPDVIRVTGGVKHPGLPMGRYDPEMASFMKLLRQPVIGGSLTGGAPEEDTEAPVVHLSYNKPTQLPDEVNQTLEQIRGVDNEPPTKRPRKASKTDIDELVQFFSCAQPELEASAANRMLLSNLHSTRPAPRSLDDVDWCPQHRWPPHVVLYTNNQLVPQQVARLMAAFQQGIGYPEQLHIVVPALQQAGKPNNTNNTNDTNDIRQQFAIEKHKVLEPAELDNTQGFTTGTPLNFNNGFFGK